MLGVGAVLVMGLAINWVAAELLALTIGFYVFVYTIWLKRRTPQNIVIGGAAGAFPPIIGWAAVTGDIGWGAIALFAIIFFWTPPHFWALVAVPHRRLRGGGRADAAGGCRTARDQAPDAALHSACCGRQRRRPGCSVWQAGSTRRARCVLSAVFTGSAIQVWRDEGERSARRMFAFSLLYLFLIFSLLLVDHTGGAWH